jgi:tRNA(Ile)-lysidine synthase
VATSGGLDSTALLHCTVAQGRSLGVEVVALHVHHGLMPEADRWLEHVRQQARRWRAWIAVTRLESRPGAGESVEAWAREQRYAALADMATAQGCSVVLLAHHRRDQAETFLLQALRGAGDAGRAAMPRSAVREGIHWLRPWLDQPREAIERYARRYRLRWVDDPSNGDARLARSRLRQEVWPALLAAFPDAEAALSAAARQAQESLETVRALAQSDLSGLVGTRGLHVARWRELPLPRANAALRGWLLDALGAPAPRSLVERLLAELKMGQTASWPAPRGVLRLHRGWLSFDPEIHDRPDGGRMTLDLSRPGLYELAGWHGSLQVESCAEGGVPPSLLRHAQVHPRGGGEQFQSAPASTLRSLKKQFQTTGVPAWRRGGPLVSSATGELLFVPQLGMNAAVWAGAGAKQLRLHWIAAR